MITSELTLHALIRHQIQQEIYLWRGGFVHEAVEVVKEQIQVKYGRSWRPQEVRPWIETLKSYDSAAYWQHPRTKTVRPFRSLFVTLLTRHGQTLAQGKLASIYYMRKTFAWHLIKTQGSVVNSGWPGGALALAAAAVCDSLCAHALTDRRLRSSSMPSVCSPLVSLSPALGLVGKRHEMPLKAGMTGSCRIS